MPQECGLPTWRSPVAFELGWVVCLSLVWCWIVFCTVRIFRQKLDRSRSLIEETKARGGESKTGGFEYFVFGCSIHGSEKTVIWVDIVLLCLFEVCLGLNLIRKCLDLLPQFEHSLVRQRGSDFRRFSSWCRVSIGLSLVLPLLQFWILCRLVYTRLFLIFEASPILRFQRRFQRIFSGVVDLTSLVLLAFVIQGLGFRKRMVCVDSWNPIDDDQKGQIYYSCGGIPFSGYFIGIGMAYLFVISVQLCTLLLFWRQFSRLLDLFSQVYSSDINDTNNDRPSPEMNEMLRLMVKLTTLTASAIVSSLIIGLFWLIFTIATDYGAVWMIFLDYTLNCVCLLLVFRVMDPSYQWICESNRYLCFIHTIVQSAVQSSQLPSHMQNQTRIESNARHSVGNSNRPRLGPIASNTAR